MACTVCYGASFVLNHSQSDMDLLVLFIVFFFSAFSTSYLKVYSCNSAHRHTFSNKNSTLFTFHSIVRMYANTNVNSPARYIPFDSHHFAVYMRARAHCTLHIAHYTILFRFRSLSQYLVSSSPHNLTSSY